MTTSVDIGQKLWNYCNILRDAGLSYGDYLEQLTYLIFLKMMDERSRPPYTLLPGLSAAAHPRGLPLARPAGPRRRRVGGSLPPHPGDPGPCGRHLGRHLPKGPEPHSGAGHADPAGAGADQQRGLAATQRRREGRRLRVAAGTQRPGREDRRRAVLHAASADPGHRGRDAPRPRRHRLRPGLRHRRLPAGGPRLHRHRESVHGPGPAGVAAARRHARLGDRGQRGAALRHEPVPARHRRRRDQHHRGRQPAGPIRGSTTTWC